MEYLRRQKLLTYAIDIGGIVIAGFGVLIQFLIPEESLLGAVLIPIGILFTLIGQALHGRS